MSSAEQRRTLASEAERKVDELAQFLEAQYARCNRVEFTLQDPVSFVHEYADPLDREVEHHCICSRV